MPILTNARHERFAQALAAGKTATEAYELAGYKPSRPNASMLKTNQNISDRVAELQGKVAAKVEVTIESLIAEAEEARQLAMETKQPAAAVSALTAKGKLAGLWVEKRENANKNVDPNSLTDAELAQAFVESDDRPGNAEAKVNPSQLN